MMTNEKMAEVFFNIQEAYHRAVTDGERVTVSVPMSDELRALAADHWVEVMSVLTAGARGQLLPHLERRDNEPK